MMDLRGEEQVSSAFFGAVEVIMNYPVILLHMTRSYQLVILQGASVDHAATLISNGGSDLGLETNFRWVEKKTSLAVVKFARRSSFRVRQPRSLFGSVR